MKSPYRFRWPGMPKGTRLNLTVHPHRVACDLWVGVEYASDPAWLSAGYGGELTLGFLGFQVTFVWWPTDPEGLL